MKTLVIDANILIRAVLGKVARELIEANLSGVRFLAADVAVADAREHIPSILHKRGIDPSTALQVLQELIAAIDVCKEDTYTSFKQDAIKRIPQDKEDWPMIACALTHNCPIWTQDKDFFGCGIATWTTSTVPIFFASP